MSEAYPQSEAGPTTCLRGDGASIESSMQPPTFRSVTIAQVVEQTGFDRADILSRKAARPIAHARQAVYAGLRERGWSFEQIGRAMDRDHSTVIFGVVAHQRRQSASA